jgi:biofilm PGA synthesis protein PgaD
MRAERPIISQPERQTWKQRLTSDTLTGIAWAIWLYLWLPALSAILWILGIRLTYIHIVRAADKGSLLAIFVIAALCNVIVTIWSKYNYTRFVGKMRRCGAETVSHEVVAKSFGQTHPETLLLILQERCLTIHFDDAGVPIRFDAVETEDSEMTLTEAELVSAD